MGSLSVLPDAMHSRHLLDVPLVKVVAPKHPLAKYKGIVPPKELQRHVPVVLTDPSTLPKGQNYVVFSKNAWRLADTRLPNVSDAQFATFYDEIVAWIYTLRRVAGDAAREDEEA